MTCCLLTSSIDLFALSQDKIHKLYERKLHGDFDTNSHIQKKKEFRNPRYAEHMKCAHKPTHTWECYSRVSAGS